MLLFRPPLTDHEEMPLFENGFRCAVPLVCVTPGERCASMIGLRTFNGRSVMLTLSITRPRSPFSVSSSTALPVTVTVSVCAPTWRATSIFADCPTCRDDAGALELAEPGHLDSQPVGARVQEEKTILAGGVGCSLQNNTRIDPCELGDSANYRGLR